MPPTIFKYPLYTIAGEDRNELIIHSGARFLHVGLDPKGIPCVWAEVYPDAEKVIRKVYLVGTGDPVPRPGTVVDYIGSCVSGSMVIHVYVSAVEQYLSNP